jgi:glycosyltransferase involved in cell wall biosynthesis
VKPADRTWATIGWRVGSLSRLAPAIWDFETVPPDPRFLAVVPAYNEAACIAGVVEALRRDAPGFDVLVVDDGSDDDTAALARRAGAAVLRLPFNLGIGGAVQAGFIYARERGYSYMAQVDGDGQHNASELAVLEEVMRLDASVDVVSGSRFLDPDGSFQSTRSRRVGIWMFARILSRLVGRPVTDPTSGFRLYNRRAIAMFARHYPHDYPEVEAVLLLHRSGLLMQEVPVAMKARAGGRSSISATGAVYYMCKVAFALLLGMVRFHDVSSAEAPPLSLASDGPG